MDGCCGDCFGLCIICPTSVLYRRLYEGYVRSAMGLNLGAHYEGEALNTPLVLVGELNQVFSTLTGQVSR